MATECGPRRKSFAVKVWAKPLVAPESVFTEPDSPGPTG